MPPAAEGEGDGGGGKGPRPACFVLWGPQGGGVVQGLPQGSDLFPVLGGGGVVGGSIAISLGFSPAARAERSHRVR